MKTVNLKEYIIKLQPITPIFIGNGELVEPYQYVVSKGKYYYIKVNKLIESLNKNERYSFVEKLNQGSLALRSFVDKLDWEDHVAYRADVAKSFAIEYEKKLSKDNNQLLVDQFINSIDRPYIPGSSIKGALRTAYLNIKGEDISYSVERIGKRGRIKVSDARKKAHKIEGRTLKYNNFFADPFQTIKLSDSNFVKNSIIIYDTAIYTFKKDKCSPGPSSYKESLLSLLANNFEGYFTFQLTIVEGKQQHTSKNGKLKIGIEELIEVTKKFSFKLLKSELDFLSKRRQTNKLKAIYKRLEKIHGNLRANESLIRFGGGSGYNAVSLNEANQKGKVTTISRLLAQKMYPYGWVLLSYHDVDDGGVQLDENRLETIELEYNVVKKGQKVKQNEKYPDLTTYVVKIYGEKEARKMALLKVKGNNSLYEKYAKEYKSVTGGTKEDG